MVSLSQIVAPPFENCIPSPGVYLHKYSSCNDDRFVLCMTICTSIGYFLWICQQHCYLGIETTARFHILFFLELSQFLKFSTIQEKFSD